MARVHRFEATHVTSVCPIVLKRALSWQYCLGYTIAPYWPKMNQLELCERIAVL